MPSAETTVVDGMLHIGLCESDLCTCKTGFDSAEPDYLRMAGTRSTKTDITTELELSSPDGARRIVSVSGVPSIREVAKAYQMCEGPTHIGTRLVCGAIYNLSRKRRNG